MQRGWNQGFRGRSARPAYRHRNDREHSRERFAIRTCLDSVPHTTGPSTTIVSRRRPSLGERTSFATRTIGVAVSSASASRRVSSHLSSASASFCVQGALILSAAPHSLSLSRSAFRGVVASTSRVVDRWGLRVAQALRALTTRRAGSRQRPRSSTATRDTGARRQRPRAARQSGPPVARSSLHHARPSDAASASA